jgi:histidine triad (HIT) family protein
MGMSSIFSKIIAREIPAQIIYEDDLCVAFHDINPQAPTHFLVIPKKEIPRLASASPEDEALLGHLLLTARELAKQQHIGESGFRIVINSGPDGGETVPHLHVHVLGGRHMEWPPG